MENSSKKILDMVMQHLSFSSDDTITMNTFMLSLKNFTNASLSTLCQNGIGRVENSDTISNQELTWDDFFDDKTPLSVKQLSATYVYTKVQLLFDPPNNSATTILEKYCEEMLWRAREEMEYGTNETGT